MTEARKQGRTEQFMQMPRGVMRRGPWCRPGPASRVALRGICLQLERPGRRRAVGAFRHFAAVAFGDLARARVALLAVLFVYLTRANLDLKAALRRLFSCAPSPHR